MTKDKVSTVQYTCTHGNDETANLLRKHVIVPTHPAHMT